MAQEQVRGPSSISEITSSNRRFSGLKIGPKGGTVVRLGNRGPYKASWSKGDRPVELTLDPAFVLAAGHLHSGGAYRMPEITWRALDATRWHLRFLDPACRRILAAYTFEKATPAELPPSYAEMKGLEA